MSTKTCIVCKTDFEILYPSWANKKYCSSNCYWKTLNGKRVSPKTEFKSGQKGAHWKGGEQLVGGYIYIWSPNHHRAQKSGYVKNSFIVAEMKIGRKLKDNEIVHHIDQDKRNDNPENLCVMDKTDHISFHAQERWNNNNFRKQFSEEVRQKMSLNHRRHQTRETRKKISETMKRRGISPQLYK